MDVGSANRELEASARAASDRLFPALWCARLRRPAPEDAGGSGAAAAGEGRIFVQRTSRRSRRVATQGARRRFPLRDELVPLWPALERIWVQGLLRTIRRSPGTARSGRPFRRAHRARWISHERLAGGPASGERRPRRSPRRRATLSRSWRSFSAGRTGSL